MNFRGDVTDAFHVGQVFGLKQDGHVTVVESIAYDEPTNRTRITLRDCTPDDMQAEYRRQEDVKLT